MLEYKLLFGGKVKLRYSLVVLTVLNLVAMIAAIFALPPQVPIHFDANMIVDKMGPPWILVILSIISLACAIGLVLELAFRKQDYKNTKVLIYSLYILACFFIYLNWVFFGMCASGLALGQKLSISLSLLIISPLGVLLMILGGQIHKINPYKPFGLKNSVIQNKDAPWQKTHEVAGKVMQMSGFVSIVGAVLAFLVKVEWLSLVIFASSILIFVIVMAIYVRVSFNKEKEKRTIEEKKSQS